MPCTYYIPDLFLVIGMKSLLPLAVLFIIASVDGTAETYMRDMCLAFKPLYWTKSPQKRPQFAVLTVNHAGGWDPSHPDQHYQPWPLTSHVGHNYVSAAYMKDPTDPNPAHTEPVVLNQLHTIWNNFVDDFARSPSDVVLFTYNSPCNRYGGNDCAGLIIQFAEDIPFSHAKWYVGYNQMFRARSQTKAQAEEQLNEARVRLNSAGVGLYQICNCRGQRVARSAIAVRENGCKPSFQMSMFQCMGATNFIEVLRKHSWRPHSFLAVIINKAVYQCPKQNRSVDNPGCWFNILRSFEIFQKGNWWELFQAIRPVFSCLVKQRDYRLGRALDPFSARNGYIKQSDNVKHFISNYKRIELFAITRPKN